MTVALLYKLLSIAVAAALGWIAARRNWLGGGPEAARILSNCAFFIFVPALLFRTTARLDFETLPGRTLAAFFVPLIAVELAVYFFARRGHGAAPGVRAISATFGNTVQIGIPMAAALFGEAGLAIHVTIVSLHALLLLAVVTTLVELSLAREAGRSSLAATMVLTLRNTIIHPVVLPVVAGLAFNAAGLTLPAAIDEALALLATAVVPVCLVLIGVSLATYGLGGGAAGAVRILVVKLLVVPALVFAFAHFALGLTGLPLSVVVLMAAMPVGSNALIFAQRYRTLEAEATAAIVLSTVAFAATAPLWLALLGWVNGRVP
jgi:malonate transporter and related proteins